MIERNYTKLLFACIALAFIAFAIPSMAQAQHNTTPIRDPDHLFEKTVCSYKQIKEMHIVMQKRDYSCGAAALATILHYYWGDNVSEDQILYNIEKILTPEEMRDRVKKGLAISDLRRAAVEMGYVSSIGTLTFRQLTESKVPLIVGIKPESYDHFVVYRGYDCENVYLADPIRGNIRLPIPIFISQWQKNAILVVIKPDQDPPTKTPLFVRSDEIERGELNKQLIRTQPEKVFSNPVVFP